MNRRSFIKKITALVTSIPVVGLVTNNHRVGLYAEHIQRVNISTKFGREPVLELGRNKPYTTFSIH